MKALLHCSLHAHRYWGYQEESCMLSERDARHKDRKIICINLKSSAPAKHCSVVSGSYGSGLLYTSMCESVNALVRRLLAAVSQHIKCN